MGTRAWGPFPLIVGLSLAAACAPDLQTGGGSGSGSGGAGGSASGSGGGSASGGGGGSASGGGSAGGSGGGSSSGSGGAGGQGGAPATCPVVADTASMVLIDGTTKYCIDSTEVTNAQYLAWLLKTPDPSKQPLECTGNVFLPQSGSPPTDDKPVVNVDWCDAYGYCAANGKRLCGKPGGGPTAWGSVQQPGGSQWYKACSKGGALAFPYGNTYQITACNVGDAMPLTPWPVASQATCEGGYPGIFDMSGNVWEWEDSCDPNSTKCRRRGGSFTNDSSNVACDVGGTFERLGFASNTGFRCCADIAP